MGLPDVLVQETLDQLRLRAGGQVRLHSVVFLLETLVGLLQIGRATTVRNKLLGLGAVVIRGFLEQNLFKFLLVYFARMHSYLQQHLDCLAHLRLLDDMAIAFTANLGNQLGNQFLLDGGVENYVVFELRILHLLHWLELHFGHIVFVHVEQDVLNHYYAQLLVSPQSVQSAQKLVVRLFEKVLRDRLEQLSSGVLYVGVEHLAVLVQNQVVGCAVELLVGETTSLLVLNFVDGVTDCLPVLGSLVASHVSFTHFLSVNLELNPLHHLYL